MYVNPTFLPQFSNREDLLLTVSLFDDDTGNALDLVRYATSNGQAFTGSSWTVTDGVFSSASTTSITIPAYPYEGELLALLLTIDPNLGILPGDPIQIIDPTGLNVMNGYVVSYAIGSGALVCQIGVSYQFEIRTPNREMNIDDAYAPYYDFGIVPQSMPVISASLGNGISVIDIGVIQIRIPESIMRKLRHRTYLASLTMFDGADTRQVFAGRLPMLWGGVTQ